MIGFLVIIIIILICMLPFAAIKQKEINEKKANQWKALDTFEDRIEAEKEVYIDVYKIFPYEKLKEEEKKIEKDVEHIDRSVTNPETVKTFAKQRAIKTILAEKEKF